MMKRLLKNIVYMDCCTGEKSPCDILVVGGTVTAFGENLEISENTEIIDFEGAYLSDGWVEAHTHVEWEGGQRSLVPEKTYPSDGITYVVDAGTDGANNYRYVHEKISTLTIPGKAYLNVASLGTVRSGGELLSPANFDSEAFKKCYEQYKDEIIGVKIRIDPRVNAFIPESLKKAKELAVELGLPLIVHPTRCPNSLESVLEVLEENDVYAHSYSGLMPCILDENGKVKECVLEARKRGVWFDLSHGSNNFTFETARKAIEQGFVVDTISTDLHTANLTAPVRSLADTMSKMLYLGLSVEEIINKVTVMPAKMLRLKDKSFGLQIGKKADFTAFRVEEGRFFLSDSAKQVVEAKERISTVMTFYGNNVYSPRTGIYLQ